MQKKTLSLWLNPLYLLFWSGLSLYMGGLNQPFANEAQSFLIARDATLSELVTTVARTEGSPLMWFLYLKVWLTAGLTYENIYLTAVVPNFLAVSLWLYKAPFSKSVKYLFPLTYFVLYQYNIIARSYSLVLLFVILAAVVYPRRHQHCFLFAITIILLGSITAQTFILACGITAMGLWEDKRLPENKKEYAAYGIISLFFLFNVWLLWPERGNLYLSNKYSSLFILSNVWQMMSIGFINTYPLISGKEVWSILGLAYFVGVLSWLKRYCWVSLFWLVIPNMLFMAVVPFRVWHAGLLIMTLIFIFWQYRPKPADCFFKGMVGCFFVVQLYWSGFAVNNLVHKFKYAKEAHAFLQQQGIKAEDILIYNFNGLSISPYFKDAVQSYWDWRKHGFIRKETKEELETYQAIVFTEEYIQFIKDNVAKFAKQNGYSLKVFPAELFEGMTYLPKVETLYVYYKEHK